MKGCSHKLEIWYLPKLSNLFVLILTKQMNLNAIGAWIMPGSLWRSLAAQNMKGIRIKFKSNRIKYCQVIGPSVFIWRKSKAKYINKNLDHIFSIFKNESKYYKPDIYTYIGHI